MANILWEIEIWIRKIKSIRSWITKRDSSDSFDSCYQLLSCAREEGMRETGAEVRQEFDEIVSEYQSKMIRRNLPEFIGRGGTIRRQGSLNSENNEIYTSGSMNSGKIEYAYPEKIANHRAMKELINLNFNSL